MGSNSTSVEFPIFIQLRECDVGEQFTDSGKYAHYLYFILIQNLLDAFLVQREIHLF
jgi:hypothetical protein